MEFSIAAATDAPAWDWLVNIRLSVEEMLRRKGIAQWQGADAQEGMVQLRRWFERGEMRLISVRDGGIAGGFALSGYADPALWPGKAAKNWLYLYKVMVAPEFAGQGVCAHIVSYCAERAAWAGKRGLRLDCYRDNPVQQAIWESHGFRHVKTVESVLAVGYCMQRRCASIVGS